MTVPQYKSPTISGGGTFIVDEADRKVQKTEYEIPAPSKANTTDDSKKGAKSEKGSASKK
jgi:hypothetical protein